MFPAKHTDKYTMDGIVKCLAFWVAYLFSSIYASFSITIGTNCTPLFVLF